MYNHEQSQTLFAISCLKREAIKHILILDESKRKTTDMIFQVLNELCGDKMPLSALRSLCFSCRQDPGEAEMEFSLRLHELFQKLQRPKWLVRDRPLLRDQREEPSAHCHQATEQMRLPPPPLNLQQLKKDTRVKMAAQIRDQVSSITQEVIKGLKAELGLGAARPLGSLHTVPTASNRQPHGQGPGQAHHPPQPWRRQRGDPPALTSYHFNKYGEQGHPISLVM